MGSLRLAAGDFQVGDFLLRSQSLRGNIEPTARTRTVDMPADEVTSLLLGWKAEGQAVEQRLPGGTRRRSDQVLESPPCRQ